MDIKELKDKVENNTLDDSFLILNYSDNSFICNQYINQIAKNKGLMINYIDNISQVRQDIFGSSSELNVIKCESFDQKNVVFDNLKNTIVICSKVEDKDKYVGHLVVIPKLIDWQIEDYIQTIIPGLDKDQIQWLCHICKNDVYRVTNEAKKINCVEKELQKKLFNEIIKDNGYCDLDPLTVFDLINAIVKRDRNKIIEVLSRRDFLDLEPYGIITMLFRNLSKIIQVQMNPSVTPEGLGVTNKQFWGIKYSCGFYSNSELMDALQTVCKMDYLLKSGYLEYNRIIDYILINMI